MFEREDETVERVIQHLRRPVAIDAGLDARVMREIAQVPRQGRRVKPLWPLLAAAAVLATVVRLAPGRYRYAFLVNGVEWRADPSAPAAKDDEFGTPSSVVTVGGRGS